MSTGRKANLKNILDSLVDDDGLKTEVTITLTDGTLIKTSMYLVGTVIVGSLAFFAIRGIFNNAG
ncbi:hypothetical protein QQ008_07730 [Fulvivirgaceae bacterium BMA10]|uniref:Uncharacterized protein n=1 Tax=Splendidivirga corallicola TaxID=3051826 RepID=A0ABT8KKK6_9BACT|nr:hypothetical protein [Fulvivirgaceae bacterium BMA10]